MAAPPSLPEVLKPEPPTVKLLYLWLLPQGEVSYPQRHVGRALGLTQANVSIALKRLRSLGLVADLEPAPPRARATIRAVDPDPA